MRLFSVLLLGGLLLPMHANAADKELNQPPACPELKAEENTKLEMIGKIAAEKKPYAALAFLDAAGVKSPRADLLKANSLRQVGRNEDATAVYNKLLDSCVAAFAYQGLGLVSSSTGQREASVAYLKAATRLLPIDSAIRGDYGYALMQNGNNEAALQEYLTAIELDGNNKLAVNNLFALMYRTGQEQRAQELSALLGVSSDELARIKADQTPGSKSAPNDKATVSQGADSEKKAGNGDAIQGGACYGTSANNSTGHICTGILSPKLERVPNE